MRREMLKPLSQSVSGSHDGDHLKILVVDDDEFIRSLLAEWLHVDSYTVLCAADGAEAVNMISGHNPSVVVTDLSMPAMDGLGLCRRIRESSDVPILVFTSTLEQEGKRDCIAAGASDHAVKGITMQDFLGRVRGLVARRA